MTRRILGLNLGGRAKIGGIFGWRKFGEGFLGKIEKLSPYLNYSIFIFLHKYLYKQDYKLLLQ